MATITTSSLKVVGGGVDSILSAGTHSLFTTTSTQYAKVSIMNQGNQSPTISVAGTTMSIDAIIAGQHTPVLSITVPPSSAVTVTMPALSSANLVTYWTIFQNS